MAANPNPVGSAVIDKHAETVQQLGAVLIAEMRRSDELRNAEMHRLDELRSAESKRLDGRFDKEMTHVAEINESERRRVSEQMILRAEFNEKIREAEAKRIDAIRAVDVAAVAVAAERAAQQATVLANQVSTSADTLRTLVASTASAVAEQLRQVSQSFTERLAALEKAQYESKGGIEGSPLIARLNALESVHSNSEGRGTGMEKMYGWIVAAVGVLVAVGSILVSILRH